MGEGGAEDLKVVERCLGGDAEAFATLVARYQRQLFWGIYHRVRNYDDAQELGQIVFLKIFQNLASYDPDRPFFSWAYRIAMNESSNFLRARHPVEALPETVEPASSGPDPAQFMEMDERSREIHGAVHSLAANYREPVILCHFLQLSYEDAAQALDLPVATLKSRLFTARTQLRTLLKAHGHVS